MQTHTIFGAGQVGTRLASLLAGQGHEVRLVSRRGAGSGGHQGAPRRCLATVMPLLSATTGSDVIYNCINPAYHRWTQDWPPMSANLIAAAQAQDAVLVTLSNLYGYGRSTDPMTEQTPLGRPHSQGPSARPDVAKRHWPHTRPGASGLSRSGPATSSETPATRPTSATGSSRRMRAGKSVSMMGRLDQPHTWTYTGDAATLLATVGLSTRRLGQGLARAEQLAASPRSR